MGLIKPNKPIKWIDDNTLSDEMSNDDFIKGVKEEEKKRDIKKYGRDGIITIWKREYTYRGIKFFVNVNRYFVIGVPMEMMKGMNKLGKWAVLEYSDTFKEIAGFIEYDMDKSDWLYRDTLHGWNDKQTLKQMVEEMIDYGKSDIDWWLDKAEKELKEKHISSLKRYREVKNVLSKT